MKLTRPGLISFLLALLILDLSCGSKVASDNTDVPFNRLPQASQYFVHGDPEELIAGSVFDTEGLGSFTQTDAFHNFTLIGRVQFTERVERATVDAVGNQKELEQQNRTDHSADQNTSLISRYTFVSDGADFLYKDQETSHTGFPTLRFKNVKGRQVITHVDSEEVEAVHYSVKANGQAMSLLLRSRGTKGTVLTAFYFNRIQALRKMTRILDVPENYFLEGDGKAVTWKQDIDIHVCGKNRARYQADVAAAIAAWSSAGSFRPGFIGKYRYTVTVKNDARPFTDLNQNCVNFIDQYKNEDQENIVNMGVTLPLVDAFNQEIFNSHIFIFMNATARSDMAMLSVMTHEMGHMIGLGHEFKADANDSVFASIMGYLGEAMITVSDRKAISYLYAN